MGGWVCVRIVDILTRVELQPPRLSPLLSPKIAIHGYSFTLRFSFETTLTFQDFHLRFGATDNPLCFLYSTPARPIRSARSCINQAKLSDILEKTENTQTQAHRVEATATSAREKNWERQYTSGKSWKCVLLACKMKINGHDTNH